MHLQERDDHIDAVISREELVLLNHALNEVLNGMRIDDFATRLGASRDDAAWLLTQIGDFLQATSRD